MTENKLTPGQVDQLVTSAAKDWGSALAALECGPKFNDEQQQKLVDAIAQNANWSAFALRDITWLNEPQRKQLELASKSA